MASGLMPWATAEFIHLDTCSGYGCSRTDAKGAHISLPPSADVESLGKSVLKVLSQSRFLAVEEVDAFFDLATTEKEYEEWVQTLIQAYGYKKRRALFKNMKHCSIRMAGGVLSIAPSVHERSEGWGREVGDGLEEVTIPADGPGNNRQRIA